MKSIEIRNVPDEVHRVLKVRAAQAGVSLSDFALAELERVADIPRWQIYWHKHGLVRGEQVPRRSSMRCALVETVSTC